MIAFYNELAEYLPSSRFIFLNYGMAEPDEGTYAWIRPEDGVYRYHLSLVRRVLQGVDLAGKAVLEIGSGRGGNCYYVSHYTEAQKICGVDLCEANVAFCKQRYSKTGLHFFRGDSQALPLPDESFDVILNVESSHCYPDFDRFLSEVWRVLKQDGIFAYTDFWSLDILPLDWRARWEALHVSRFELLSEEDITWKVFQALREDDGLSKFLLDMKDRENTAFIRRVVQSNRAMRLTLAARQCTYKIWRFRKHGRAVT